MKLAVVLVMSIVHVMHGCHVWATADGRPLGATKTVVVKHGTSIQIEIMCPMDFDVSQVAGPKVSFGDTRWRAGTRHTLAFAKRGVYRFVARNVQTPEERGLQTLGPTNTPRLIVRVS